MGEKVYLSDMERRLLTFLVVKGAHHSVYEIGKQLRVSPQTVAYKIKQFEERGVIRSYRYRLNPYKIGFSNMTWCALDVNRHMEIEDMEEKMLAHPNVFSVLVLAGQMDLLVKVFYSRYEELTELVEWMGLTFKDCVSGISLVPVIRLEKLHQIHGFDRTRETLDKGSMLILQHKLVHPSDSLKDTAEALGMHRNTVSRKWNELWQRGVLLKKSLFIEPEVYSELGFGISSCVFMDTVPGQREHAIKEIIGMDFVHELYSLAFRRDLMAITRASDINHCYSNVKQIYSKNVHDTETLFILSSKERDLQPLTVHG